MKSYLSKIVSNAHMLMAKTLLKQAHVKFFPELAATEIAQPAPLRGIEHAKATMGCLAHAVEACKEALHACSYMCLLPAVSSVVVVAVNASGSDVMQSNIGPPLLELCTQARAPSFSLSFFSSSFPLSLFPFLFLSLFSDLVFLSFSL